MLVFSIGGGGRGGGPFLHQCMIKKNYKDGNTKIRQRVAAYTGTSHLRPQQKSTLNNETEF